MRFPPTLRVGYKVHEDRHAFGHERLAIIDPVSGVPATAFFIIILQGTKSLFKSPRVRRGFFLRVAVSTAARDRIPSDIDTRCL